MKKITIAVDFDGTLCEHEYPLIGKEVPGAIETVRKLIAKGHKVVLWTMRSGKKLDEAVAWCRERGITFYGVNDNKSQNTWAADARKVFANLYIDDAALGCPLFYPGNGRAYVNWEVVHSRLNNMDLL